VRLEPLHPNEAALHHALRDALNRRLTTTDFFVWINIRPTGLRKNFENLDGIVEATEAWLLAQDPDTVSAEALPEQTLLDPAADVTVRAIPKKTAARGHRASEIVGNPEPALAGWV